MRYRFTDSVPYMLNRAGVRLGERFTRRLEPYDVTLPMYRVLAVLRQSGTKTLGELSELVSIELSTLSRLVGILVRRNLVSRERPPENARIVLIDVTEAGGTLADQLMKIAMHFEDTVVADLEQSEIQAFKTLLRQINQQVDKL